MDTLKVGDKVIDIWYKEWGVGTCIAKTKRLWSIDFENKPHNNPIKYDKLHVSLSLQPYTEDKLLSNIL